MPRRPHHKRKTRRLSGIWLWIARVVAIVSVLYIFGSILLYVWATIGFNGVVGLIGLVAGTIVLAIGLGRAIPDYMRRSRWELAERERYNKRKNDELVVEDVVKETD